MFNAIFAKFPCLWKLLVITPCPQFLLTLEQSALGKLLATAIANVYCLCHFMTSFKSTAPTILDSITEIHFFIKSLYAFSASSLVSKNPVQLH